MTDVRLLEQCAFLADESPRQQPLPIRSANQVGDIVVTHDL